MTIDQIMTGLASHPDASRKCGDGDPLRVAGLCEVKLLPSGKVVVLYHCGLREFANLDEVRGWLLGNLPPSWT